MNHLEEAGIRDGLRELNAYAREFFRIQMLWVMFIGMTNVGALVAFYSQGIRLEANVKPPLCVGFALLNLLTAAQFVVRRFDFLLMGRQMDEFRHRLGYPTGKEGAPFLPLELMIRTGRLFVLAMLLLAAVWAVGCLHVWNHETMPVWVYIASAVTFVVVAAVIGFVLGRQILNRRQHLAQREVLTRFAPSVNESAS